MLYNIVGKQIYGLFIDSARLIGGVVAVVGLVAIRIKDLVEVFEVKLYVCCQMAGYVVFCSSKASRRFSKDS